LQQQGGKAWHNLWQSPGAGCIGSGGALAHGGPFAPARWRRCLDPSPTLIYRTARASTRSILRCPKPMPLRLSGSRIVGVGTWAMT